MMIQQNHVFPFFTLFFFSVKLIRYATAILLIIKHNTIFDEWILANLVDSSFFANNHVGLTRLSAVDILVFGTHE